MLFKPERRQLRHDFFTIPRLVREYCPESEHREALKMVRQINTVTTYLSWMATGETRHAEGIIYGVAVAGMDEVTDELNEPLADGKTIQALADNPPVPSLNSLPVAVRSARGPDFEHAIHQIARWQDASLEQFEDPDSSRLWEITRQKGGYSALAHLHAVKEDPSPAENEFMFEFGALMQLLDDYHDQPRDETAGVSTLFTAGEMEVADLVQHAERTFAKAHDLWDRPRAIERFRKVVELHLLMGDLENHTPLRSSWLFPWYF